MALGEVGGRGGLISLPLLLLFDDYYVKQNSNGNFTQNSNRALSTDEDVLKFSLAD